MSDIIKLKRSAVQGAAPTSLEFGELALNYHSSGGKIYYKDSTGAIVSLSGGGLVTAATASAFPATGSTELLYLATDDSRLFYWSGSVYVEAGTAGGSGSGEDTTLRAVFLPGAPTSVTATPGNAQASVSWTAPAALSVLPITDYVVQYSSNSGSTWTTFSDGTSATASATVSGLTNSTAYVFRVAAVNALGQGAWSSASSSVTPQASVFVQALVIAGGGSGGVDNGGGGGAGGYLYSSSLQLEPATQYTVTVGGGGAMPSYDHGVSGSNSVFSTLTAIGGGGAGGQAGVTGGAVGYSGGSGGGGGNTNAAGGAGTSGQGFAGGQGNSGSDSGGGGGGAGEAGQNAPSDGGGEGGDGLSSSITGTAVYRAGGGGGGTNGSFGGAGGLGGGGGGAVGGTLAGNGDVNTGSGGGGLRYFSSGSGSGASGVVIIRSPVAAASTTGSPSVTTVGSDTVYTFTGSGSITF